MEYIIYDIFLIVIRNAVLSEYEVLEYRRSY
jgi:hypothetical protein